MPATWRVFAQRVFEWRLQSATTHLDPFNELEVDVIFIGPGGEQSVPAFWAGGQEWAFRFSAAVPGVYSFRSVCSDPQDMGLHGFSGSLEVLPVPEGETNPLYRLGGLRVAAGKTHLEHADGTPFFWLGDTWWMALCGRMGWPEDFRQLVADRKAKGFTLAHLVAGLFPDVPPQDQRGWNQGGSAWEDGFTRINPAFYDHADLKLEYMLSQGIVPLIVGAWGYYLPVLGIEKMRKHWRYLIARWAAYPLVWCLAGEVAMAYYLAENRDADIRMQREGWSELGAYLRRTDSFHRPITAHSCAMGESPRELTDPSFLDFNFIQTGHGNHTVALAAAKHVRKTVVETNLKPVINSETCYEGILGTSLQDVQRFCFWSSFLSGAPGYSYGGNGIWQVNQPGRPFGPSPHGMSWGDTPWTEAMRLPGSAQISLGKRLLEAYPWWQFEAHPDWIETHAGGEEWFRPYAAGVPGKVRVIYFPGPLAPWGSRPRILMLEKDIAYTAFFFNPITGERTSAVAVLVDADGSWMPPAPSAGQDNVLVLEAVV